MSTPPPSLKKSWHQFVKAILFRYNPSRHATSFQRLCDVYTTSATSYRRRIDVETTSATSYRRRIDVETTSCVYWDEASLVRVPLILTVQFAMIHLVRTQSFQKN